MLSSFLTLHFLHSHRSLSHPNMKLAISSFPYRVEREVTYHLLSPCLISYIPTIYCHLPLLPFPIPNFRYILENYQQGTITFPDLPSQLRGDLGNCYLWSFTQLFSLFIGFVSSSTFSFCQLRKRSTAQAHLLKTVFIYTVFPSVHRHSHFDDCSHVNINKLLR